MRPGYTVGLLGLGLAVGGAASAADAAGAAGPGAVQFTGWLGARLTACAQHGLVEQPLEPLIAPFRDKTEVGDGDWRCEYWGKWFTGLALADAYLQTPRSARVRDEAVAALVATADDDGYLGTRSREHRGAGWDVWGRKYALLGLLAAYDRTGAQGTLAAAMRAGDTLIAQFGPGGANLPDYGFAAWKGLPTSSVLEPIVRLYQRSGEQRFLDFAAHIVAAWSRPSALAPEGMRLIESALSGARPVEYVAAKAYEMMSCFEGLCELYRATGNEDYKRAALALGEGVLAHETTILGCGTSREVWCDGRTRQTEPLDMPMETCVTATWMKYAEHLWQLTGEPRWIDELERNLYNALLPAMMPSGRWWAYFSSPNGERVPSYIQHADVGLSCCVVNGPRALLRTPRWAVGTLDGAPCINLYAPGHAMVSTPAGQQLGLHLSGDYPFAATTQVRLDLEQPERFTLVLRSPAWSPRWQVRINGEPVEVEGAGYVRLEREWRGADHLELRFDLTVRAVAAPDGNGQVALVRGPVVLSLSERLNTAAAGTFDLPTGVDGEVTGQLDPELAAEAGTNVALRVSDGTRAVVFCDYASAGTGWSTTDRFRTWLTNPLELGGTSLYDTGQDWRSLSHQRDHRPAEPPAGEVLADER
ncbi:MAG TPA: hypothetical protein DCZ72_15790 [Armatimonadetes bacterium]|nr:hypothetical protein [Armatimonadota bacterium]